MIYIVCFAISVMFAYMAYRDKKEQKFILFSVLSILLPVFLAGLRDRSIGIDTSNYYEMERYWSVASVSDSVWQYMAGYSQRGLGEYFFALLVGIIGQTGNFTLLLLIIHAWIIFFVYVGAYRLREHVQPWLVLVLFYLAFFNHSLNVMRQYMALSFMFAFLMDLPQKRYLRYMIAVAVATMFHTTALLSLGLLLIHWVLYGDFERLKAGLNPSLRQRQIFIFTAVAALIVIFNPLVRLLISVGLLHEKYMFYVKNPFKSYNLLVTLFLLVEMGAIWFLRNNLKEKKPIFETFFTFSVVYFLLYQVTAVTTYGKRIAACCSLANLVTLAMLPQGLGDAIEFTLPRWLGGKHIVVFRFLGSLDAKKKQTLGTILVICGVLVYWLYVYMLRNASKTMPYRFIF